ncbi:MAG: dihydroorotase [Deltaproteobacteria bacterium]|nr:dihydroorotase [Deltaproteobacteria bacterium]
MRIVLKHVRLLDPGTGLDGRDRTVVIEDGVIRDLDAPGSAVGDREIYRRGVLVPGFIDLRAQLGEPGHSRQETIPTALKAAASGGFTTVVAMPSTLPAVDQPEVVELILAKARKASAVNVLPAGALSVGREGKRLAEMAKLKAAGCVMFTDADRGVKDSQLLRYAMETADDLGLPVATHAEDESLSLGGVMHEGLVSTRLGLAGVPSAAEVVGVARDLAIAELTGARLHIAHVTTGAAVELIRQAKRRGVRVTADVSPLHLLLADDAVEGYDTMAKIFPPLRPKSDVDAITAALAEGTIDAVASDHCPQSDLDKNLSFNDAKAGAIGLETASAVVLSLVHEGRLDLRRAISVLTTEPARILNLPSLARIGVGARADLVLLDLERTWRFERSDVCSRSSNTPLLGRKFTGRVALTITGGQIAYEQPANGGHAE